MRFGFPCRCNSRTQFFARVKESVLVISYTMMAAAAPLREDTAEPKAAEERGVSAWRTLQSAATARACCYSRQLGTDPPVVHRRQAVVPFLSCGVPARPRTGPHHPVSPGASSDLLLAHRACSWHPYHISNLTLSSGIVLVRKAAPTVDACTPEHAHQVRAVCYQHGSAARKASL